VSEKHTGTQYPSLSHQRDWLRGTFSRGSSLMRRAKAGSGSRFRGFPNRWNVEYPNAVG